MLSARSFSIAAEKAVFRNGSKSLFSRAVLQRSTKSSLIWWEKTNRGFLNRHFATAAVVEHGSLRTLEDGRKHVVGLLSSITRVPEDLISDQLRPNFRSTCDFSISIGSLSSDGSLATAEQVAEWAAQLGLSKIVERPIISGRTMELSFKPDLLARLTIPQVLSDRVVYGSNETLGLRDPDDPAAGRQKLLIEFSSPNIAKPFHAGHLRSTIIGSFLANLYEVSGWDVTRYNFLGDWGRQYGLLAIGFERYGSTEKLTADPIGHLYEVYVKVNAVALAEEKFMTAKQAVAENMSAGDPERKRMEKEVKEAKANSTFEDARICFRKLEEGDANAIALWTRFREVSIQKYEQIYSRLNITYDRYAGESGVKKSAITQVVGELESRGLCEESEGSLLIDFDVIEKRKRLGKAIIRKRDGSTIYLSRDAGAAIQRYRNFSFDKMIYVVASQQDRHMAQVIKILELVGRQDVAEKSLHVNFGMVNGMSTRKGTVKFLDDILNEARDKMLNVMLSNKQKFAEVSEPDKTADILGISAVVVQDMKSKRRKNYEFDLNLMTSIEGDTGPYLQYAHARLSSIARKAGIANEDLRSADLSLLKEPKAIAIVRVLALWPAIVSATYKNHEPSTIITYLFNLAHVISSSYNELRVIGSEPELFKARLALYEAARQVLENGLRLIGLTPLHRM